MAGSYPLEENWIEETACVRFSDYKIEHCNTDGNTLAEFQIETGTFKLPVQTSAPTPALTPAPAPKP